MIWWLLLSGETLLGCEAGGEKLGARRWLLLDTNSSVGGVGEGVARAIVGLGLAGSVLATLGVRVDRGRGGRGSACIYGRSWDLSGRFPL